MICRNCGRAIVQQEEWGDIWWEHEDSPWFKCSYHTGVSTDPEPLLEEEIVDKILKKYSTVSVQEV